MPPRRKFFLIAGLSAFVYLLIFSLPYPLSEHYNKIPPVDYAKLSNYSVAGFIAYVVGLAITFVLYLWALRLLVPKSGQAPRAVIGLRFVLLTGALLAAVLLLSYPLGAIDVFVYAIYTRGWALHGLNPLATAPAQYPAGDPWLGLAAEWIDAPSPYGPVWQLLSLGAYYCGRRQFPAASLCAEDSGDPRLPRLRHLDLSDLAAHPPGLGARRHNRFCVESAGADRGGAERAQRHRHDLLPVGGSVGADHPAPNNSQQ